MPQVPLYGDSKIQERGLPDARLPTSAPAGAFGGQPRVDAAVQGLLGAGAKLVEAEQRKADEVAFQDADLKASQLQTRLEIAAKQRLGKEAGTAPDLVDQEWVKESKTILDGLGSDRQKALVQKALLSRRAQLDRTVQVHLASETKRWDDETTEGWLTASMDEANAAFSDIGRVADILERQQLAVEAWGRRNGLPEDKVALKRKEVQGKTLAGVIGRTLDAGKIEDARELFEANRDAFREDEAAKVATDIQKRAAWEQVVGMRLPDRRPDEAKMREAVMAMDDIPAADRDQVWGYVKARAGELAANLAREEQANDRRFQNALITARKNGEPLDAALRLADQMGLDAYDREAKAVVARKLYENPGQSDPVRYIALWESVQNGQATKRDINAGLNDGWLNLRDWEALQKDLYRATQEGASPEAKLELERQKDLIKRKFPNKRQQEDALYAILAGGKSPAERQRILDELDKRVPDSASIWDWNGQTRLERDVARLDAQRSVAGAAVTAQQKIERDLADPQSEAALVRGWLRAHGKDTSSATILKVLQLDPTGKEWRK